MGQYLRRDEITPSVHPGYYYDRVVSRKSIKIECLRMCIAGRQIALTTKNTNFEGGARQKKRECFWSTGKKAIVFKS